MVDGAIAMPITAVGRRKVRHYSSAHLAKNVTDLLRTNMSIEPESGFSR